MMKDALGDRMKSYYEDISKTKLLRRTPVILRLDGKAFHTFTRGFKKPFDPILVKAMQETMKYLCENIQGCVLGYTQSDEITLVLVDYNKLETSAWFDYEVQKMTSISASMATLAFNRILRDLVSDFMPRDEEEQKYRDSLVKAVDKGALFDSRPFNMPKEEVTNCILWRQLDAERNSILSLAQSLYNNKEIEKLNLKELKTKMEEEKGVIWGNLPTTLKRGSCCVKIYQKITGGEYNSATGYKDHYTPTPDAERGVWTIDNEMPRLIGDARDYVEKLIWIGEGN